MILRCTPDPTSLTLRGSWLRKRNLQILTRATRASALDGGGFCCIVREFCDNADGFCRLCPGAHLADQSLFITCAMVLAAFEINQVVDEHGRAIVPEVAYKSGTIWYARPNFSTTLTDDRIFSHPKPFQCDIKPRSAKAEALIVSS